AQEKVKLLALHLDGVADHLEGLNGLLRERQIFPNPYLLDLSDHVLNGCDPWDQASNLCRFLGERQLLVGPNHLHLSNEVLKPSHTWNEPGNRNRLLSK